MIPLCTPDVSGREAEYLNDCIASTFVSSVGSFVTRFEESIAIISGTSDCIVVSSGTIALKLALEGFDIGEGDLVICPSLTFIATSNAISHTGAQPWLFDCTSDGWGLDFSLVRDRLENETVAHDDGRLHIASGKIVKAIMPVLIMGSPINFDDAVALGKEFSLRVVVDGAAAIGGLSDGNRPFGETGIDAICYSFNGNKTVTCGGGGAIATSKTDYAKTIKHLSATGRVGRDYDHDVIAYNYRMTNVQAAIGVAQMERLDSFLRRKHEIYMRYKALSDMYSFLEPFPTFYKGVNTFWFSGLFLNQNSPSLADEFRAFMQDNSIDVRKFWKPIHLQKPYADAMATEMPVSNEIWQQIFPLPCSSHLTDAQLGIVCDKASQFWNNASGKIG